MQNLKFQQERIGGWGGGRWGTEKLEIEYLRKSLESRKKRILRRSTRYVSGLDMKKKVEKKARKSKFRKKRNKE
jgi:hypothetical protein